MATTVAPGAIAIPAPDDDVRIERHGVWKRFRRHRLALVGAIVITLVTIVAFSAKILAPADPNFIDQANWSGYPLAPGVAHHILGTDENGRPVTIGLPERNLLLGGEPGAGAGAR